VLEAEEGWEAWGREAGDTRETVEGVGYNLFIFILNMRLCLSFSTYDMMQSSVDVTCYVGQML
jgi:hypothetical protein